MKAGRGRPLLRWSRRRTRILIVVAALLVGLRVAAPFVLEYVINDRLRRIPEYAGRVADVDIHLWRGAYALKGGRSAKRAARLARPCLPRSVSTFRWRGGNSGAARS